MVQKLLIKIVVEVLAKTGEAKSKKELVFFQHNRVFFYCNQDLRVTAILLNGWFLPIGGAASVEGVQSMGLPFLVLSNQKTNMLFKRGFHEPNYFTKHSNQPLDD